MLEILQIKEIDQRLIRSIENMTDPDRVKGVMLDQKSQNPDPYWPFERIWNPLSLAEGYPGLLILFAELNGHNLINADDVVHQYVLRIKETIESQGLNPDLSLYNGIAGICFSLHLASCKRMRYQKMLKTLDEYLLRRIEKQYLEPIRICLSNETPVMVKLYDPIQGITGIGRYILENTSQEAMDCTIKIIKVLIDLVRPIKVEGKKVPGWYVSGQDPLNYRVQDGLSKGNFNLGLAHGVTGILAYLSIASIRGIEVEGQKDAINIIANWLQAKSFVFNESMIWPFYVSFEEEVNEYDEPSVPSRDAWCYGTPGVARSLYLAGKALGDQGLKLLAKKAFQGIFRRSFEQWEIPSPILCHGIAGLLAITQEMANEEDGEDLFEEIEKLKLLLYSAYQQEAAFGFKDIEPCRRGGQIELDKIGYLEGSVGAILSLLPLSQEHSTWKLPLLIHE
ncbi:lanthionine synthetase C family protein [Parachlamydia acanthamoebae]|uniref:lanthionine synthetase C family protein n=1 Tax=Parachlamydia acanthamoebae TaxID=83552 RepID=UPI0001C17C05|nr:lanthionine synthetase C family protein [Parachlamydia acanthamoebae]EFB41577.1 hypothetical protein pah_c028o030 [Parachlamydia acanthamoebae str. Hall's coccus]